MSRFVNSGLDFNFVVLRLAWQATSTFERKIAQMTWTSSICLFSQDLAAETTLRYIFKTGKMTYNLAGDS